jgi:hypothetical protein
MCEQETYDLFYDPLVNGEEITAAKTARIVSTTLNDCLEVFSVRKSSEVTRDTGWETGDQMEVASGL